MFAVDDGIWSGNLTAADLFFLIGVVLGFLAAILAAMAVHPRTPDTHAPTYAPAVAYAAIGCIAFGWLLL